MTRAKRLRLIARAELRRRWRTMKGNTTQLLRLRSRASCCFRSRSAGVRGISRRRVRCRKRDRATHRMGPGGVRLRVDIRGRIRWIPRVRRGAPSRQPRRPVDGGFTPGPDQWPPPHRTRALVRVLPHSRQRRSVAFAVGAGSLLTIPALLLTLCLLLATGIPAGFIIALGVKNAGVRSRLLSRLRTLFLVLLGIGYFALIFTNAFASALEPIYRVLSPTPIDWFGDPPHWGSVLGRHRSERSARWGSQACSSL